MSDEARDADETARDGDGYGAVSWADEMATRINAKVSSAARMLKPASKIRKSGNKKVLLIVPHPFQKIDKPVTIVETRGADRGEERRGQ